MDGAPRIRFATAIFLYAAGIVVLGALLSPPVFRLVHPQITDAPFRRVSDRVFLVVALAGLWPLSRALGLRSWADLGYARVGRWWQHTLTGFGWGVASFAVAGGALLALGLRSVAPGDGLMQPVVFLLIGLAVAVVEETLFRGGVQGALQRATNLPVAVVVTSAIYSAVHFLKPKGAGIAAADVGWGSGFEYLGQVLARSWQTPGAAVGFVTLGLAGGVLGLAFVRTGALYFPVGVHAGWVFTLKTYAWLTDAAGKRTWWGGSSLVDNVLVWPVLVVMLWLVAKRLKPLPR
jgi:membrane protease YdiL (CAAX protease family)